MQRATSLTDGPFSRVCVMALSLLALAVVLLPNRLAAGQQNSDPAWRAARVELQRALALYLKTARDPKLARDDSKSTRRRQALNRIDKALQVALSPNTGAVPLIDRVDRLLPSVERLAPESHPYVHSLFARSLAKAVHSLPAEQIPKFLDIVRRAWTVKRRHMAKNVLSRLFLATQLSPLLENPEQRAQVGSTIGEILKLEVAWIQSVGSRSRTFSEALKILAKVPETPTIYPILDAAAKLYELSYLDKDSNTLLDPIVDALVACLKKIQVRVKGKRQKILEPDAGSSIRQYQLWYRVSGILYKWTSETAYVWHSEWEAFWRLYYGDDKAQDRFDYAAARQRGIGVADGASYRKAPSAAFFGVEDTSGRFLIVVDASQSMVNESRMDALKRETIRFVRSLRPGTQYNILPFSTECDMGASLAGGNRLVTKSLPVGRISKTTLKWIDALRAVGSTRVDLAFEAAFNAMGNAESPTTNGPPFREIYLIMDGSPTDEGGEILRGQDLQDLLEMIRGLNARHRVLIHCIAFPGLVSTFLRNLARGHGGKLKVLKRSEVQPQPPGD